MRVIVNGNNKRMYKCKGCGDMVSFDKADELMKELEYCNECTGKVINEMFLQDFKDDDIE